MARVAAQFLFVILLPAASLMAQAGVTVSGMVEDQSGAVIPGTKVSLVRGKTGETRTTSADERGRFLFEAVSPGKYKLSAAADGFRLPKDSPAWRLGFQSIPFDRIGPRPDADRKRLAQFK